YEYQPQILHAKLILIGDIVYAGSANLDTRSLHINYELLVRLANRGVAVEARDIFTADLKHCVQIDRRTWRSSRTLWARLKGRWAYFILAQLDPFLARQQLKLMNDESRSKELAHFPAENSSRHEQAGGQQNHSRDAQG